MTITPQRVTCQDCKRVADVELVTNAVLKVWLASVAAARCPSCGSQNLWLGGAFDDAPPKDTAVTVRANWWRDRGETGTSSLTIWASFTGIHQGSLSYPHDPDDYRRCRHLLDLIPEWRADLAAVAQQHPWFQPFVDRWNEFDRLYDLAVTTGRYDDLSALISEAESLAEDIRYPVIHRI